jgi:hypothetical protein
LSRRAVPCAAAPVCAPVPAARGKLAIHFDFKRRLLDFALAEEIQHEIRGSDCLVPLFRPAFSNAIGPRIAASTWRDVSWSFSPTGFA